MSLTIKTLLLGLLAASVFANTYAPVIGILSLPDPPDQTSIQTANVMAHYVKWVESAGGMTVAIHSWMSDEELDTLLTKINGVLFQGGSRNLILDGEYENFARKILKKVIKLKEEQDISIPLWGTCLGFELIGILLANSHDILTSFDAYNLATPLIFDQKVVKTSKMYQYFNSQDIDNLKNLHTTAHFHHWGINQENFKKYNLDKYLSPTTFGIGNDKENVSIESYEGIYHPIYGVQFHPEKAPDDHYVARDIPQSPEAIKISLNLALFFISEARKNKNSFTEEDRKKYDFIDIYETKFVMNSSFNAITLYNRPSPQDQNLRFLK